MAKKPSVNIDIAKMDIKKLLNIEMNVLNRMDNATLGKVAKRLVSVANKRIDSLEKNKLQHLSSAYVHRREGVKAEIKKDEKRQRKLAKQSGTSFKMRGRGKGRPKKLSVKFKITDSTRNKNLEIVAKAKAFLSSPTSTVSGVKKVQAHITMAVGRELTEKEAKRMWKIYNELLYGKNREDGTYANVLEMIKKNNFGSQQIINDIAKRVARRKYKGDNIGTYEKSSDIINLWKMRIDQEYDKLFTQNIPEFDLPKEIKDPDALEQGDSTQG